LFAKLDKRTKIEHYKTATPFLRSLYTRPPRPGGFFYDFFKGVPSMTTLLPLDEDDNPIPAMRLKSTGGAHTISATATTARNATAFAATTKVVSVYATGAVYLRFGGSTVTAANTDHYFPEGTYYDFAIQGGKSGKGPHNTHLAVIAAGSNCTVYISEKE
jgi:hypothetical protein